MNIPFDRQSELAHEASELIQRMPDTHGNLTLVLDALIKTVSDATWADFSAVLADLEDAACSLKEVYAMSDEEMAENVRATMREAV